MNSIISKSKKLAKPLLVTAFWVLAWYIISIAVDKEVLVASPAAVAKRAYELLLQSEFYKIVFSTIIRILTGFLTAVAAGAALGIITSKIRLADELISPLLSIIKATPVASFIILALVWINKQAIPSFISFLMVLPIIHGNVAEGLKNTPLELIEMTRIYNFSLYNRLTKLYIPTVLPYFSAGFKTSLGLAWKAGVAAEVLSFPKYSIGTKLYEAKTYLETVDVFTWTLTIIIISIALEKALIWAFDKLTSKKNGGNAA